MGIALLVILAVAGIAVIVFGGWPGHGDPATSPGLAQ